MAMLAYVGLCVVMQACVGLSKCEVGYNWLCRAVYGYVGLCSPLQDGVGLYMAV